MPTASGVDVIRAAKAAGFPDDQLVTAGAVAYAESGLRTDAVANEPDGSHSYGVWQINSVHGYPETTSGTWSTLGVNAQLAHRVWQAQGWNAWSVHKPSDPVGHTRYLAAVPLATAWVQVVAGPAAAASGAAAATTGEVDGAAGAAKDVLSSPLGLLTKPLGVLDWLTTPDAWMRILKVGIGAALMIGGSYMLVHVNFLQPVGEKVAGLVVGGTGKAVKAAGAAKATKAAPAAAPAAPTGGS